MNRFFTEDIAGDTARITGEDVRHIARVLRLRPGDGVVLCDGRVREYTAVIERIGETEVVCRLGPGRPSPAEPAHRVTLFQALPKSGKMETLVQKCVELGVFAVAPVVTARCVALPTKEFEKKRLRYQRVALEAAKQSRRGIVPEVLGVQALSAVDFSGFDTALVAYENERERSLKEALRGGAGGRIALVVGPEGGFEEGEAADLARRGVVAVSLGARILRTETAGMAMLAQVLYELE